MVRCFASLVLVFGMSSTATAAEEVDFDTQILPVLTKAGCNSGACHGAAIGRGGFKLSLFASRPADDYDAIVNELGGRRVNLAAPELSLLLAKPTGMTEHGGDVRIEPGSAAEELLWNWLTQGVKRRNRRKIVELVIEPPSQTVRTIPSATHIRVTARYSDGESADVTAFTTFTPDDKAALEIPGNDGEVRVLRRGVHDVTLRHAHLVASARIVAPIGGNPIDLSGEPVVNFIDERVYRVLEDLRISVSPAIDDAGFLRRVRLDLTGRLPSLEETRQFLADGDASKRSRLVDRLLASTEFVEYWTFQLAKILRLRPAPKDSKGARTYHAWLAEQLASGRGFNQISSDLLVATGDSHTLGPANFHRMVGDAREEAELVSEAFMGVRLRCANCHDHPLDSWSQDDYHGLAANFARIKRGRFVTLEERGEVIHPRSGEPAWAKLPGDRFLFEQEDHLPTLASWLTGPENPYFAKAIVNRLWRQLMGRGLVEPADDMRMTNPATHPVLLDQLADNSVDHGYNLRATLRLIAESATYARSSASAAGNEVDDRFYSRSLHRLLEAEVLADAIADITGVAETYGHAPSGMRAVSLVDPAAASRTLDVLGRCSRESSCDTGQSGVSGLTRTLHVMNGPMLNSKIASQAGRLHKALSGGQAWHEIVSEFYLGALCREPTARETEFWRAEMAGAATPERDAVAEDFLWALLTCEEFVSNH